MSSMRLYSCRALVLFLTILPMGLKAQDSATGALRGVVLDSSGSRIPQASIAVVNLATGVRYLALSDAEGGFALDQLPPGDYSARAVAPGMSPQVTPQLHVDVGGVAALQFHLTVASVRESVTVSGAPGLVDTQPSAVSTLLDERALSDFPLNGRRFSDLALFSPGVTQDPRSLNSSTNGDLSFGGIRGFQNTFLVDGGDFNNAFFAQPRGRDRAPYVISTEVVQEFRVLQPPTAPSKDAPAAPSSTSSPSRGPIVCTALRFTTSETARWAQPMISLTRLLPPSSRPADGPARASTGMISRCSRITASNSSEAQSAAR